MLLYFIRWVFMNFQKLSKLTTKNTNHSKSHQMKLWTRPNCILIYFIRRRFWNVMQITCKCKNLEIKQMVFSQTKPGKQNRTAQESDILTHIGESRKLFPKNGRWLRGFPGNYFQVNIMSTYPWKNIFSLKNGSWIRGFFGNFFQYLEIVSGNSSVPLPEFSEFQISFEIWVIPR